MKKYHIKHEKASLYFMLILVYSRAMKSQPNIKKFPSETLFALRAHFHEVNFFEVYGNIASFLKAIFPIL